MPNVLNPDDPILIIDDEEAILLAVDTSLQMAGYNHILPCRDSREVEGLLERGAFSLILLDLSMPHVDGHAVLAKVTVGHPELPVIIITGAIDVETAVRCMQAGAYDYIVKPIEPERLLSAVARALSLRDLKRENLALKKHFQADAVEHPEAFAGIVTANPKMLGIFQYVESIARTMQPVLVRGETGVGKELIARSLHRLSGRRGPFVAVNVAGLDDSVFSDTLFGHVKGAFTGADKDRRGLIEQASGGTLFLDEIGDLSMASQVKLLRLLQEGEYLPLGKDEAKRADVRVVASTNADLWKRQQENTFRSDLNYRLRTHRIYIPPLRERLDDLPLLVDYFLREAALQLQVAAPEPAPGLIPLLKQYNFPGNVRELQTLVFDALSRHKGGPLPTSVFAVHIQRHQRRERGLLDTCADPESNGAQTMVHFCDTLPTLKEADHLLVTEALKRSRGNQSMAARLLGITQQALSKRLKKLKKES